MEANATNLIVQGGSLGLLTIVIILIWKYVSSRMEVEDNRMEREQKRLDQTLTFMQTLSKDITRQSLANIEVWKDLSQKTLKSLERIHERLNHVEEYIEDHNKGKK